MEERVDHEEEVDSQERDRKEQAVTSVFVTWYHRLLQANVLLSSERRTRKD